MISRLLVKTVALGSERDVEGLDEHEVQLFAVEGVEKRPFEDFGGVLDVDGRTDGDSGRVAQVPDRRRVDHRPPLEVGLQRAVLPRNDEFLGLEE